MFLNIFRFYFPLFQESQKHKSFWDLICNAFLEVGEEEMNDMVWSVLFLDQPITIVVLLFLPSFEYLSPAITVSKATLTTIVSHTKA